MAGISDSLWNDNLDANDYHDATATYHAAVFEQYKLCVEMADRVSARRNLANTFFLTLHSGLMVFLSAWLSQAPHRRVPVALALAVLLILMGMCATWWITVRSYQQLNRGKYAVIGALEERLPARTFVGGEWRALGEGRNWRIYLPLGRVERSVPLLFAGAYVLGFVAVAAG